MLESEASPAPTSSTATSHTVERSPGRSRLHVEEAELLLHFIQFTACTLTGSEADDPRTPFWTHNLPRMGLAHHFVMHLSYAVAGYHLAYLDKTGDRWLEFRGLAERHAAEGLKQFTATLARLDEANCGAAYISATLVCYCTFAAGPTGPADLLVCNLDHGPDTNWLPLIHGLRLILEMFSVDIVFSGLMDPFHPDNDMKYGEVRAALETGPKFAREGFTRLDWEQPLSDLREFVATYDGGSRSGGPDNGEGVVDGRDPCLRSLDGLIAIYKATYGDSDGHYDGSQQYQHVFGWIYRMEKQFLAYLRRKDPRALIILAYYAVLFETMDSLWFLDGWETHLLNRVKCLLPVGYASWLEWPMKVAGLE